MRVMRASARSRCVFAASGEIQIRETPRRCRLLRVEGLPECCSVVSQFERMFTHNSKRALRNSSTCVRQATQKPCPTTLTAFSASRACRHAAAAAAAFRIRFPPSHPRRPQPPQQLPDPPRARSPLGARCRKPTRRRQPPLLHPLLYPYPCRPPMQLRITTATAPAVAAAVAAI
jgi:hypothetical protein